MPERDYVDQDFKFSYTGIFDDDELYKALYRWFRKHGYTWRELDCRDYKIEGKRRCFIKWEAEKEISDYVQYKIETEITMTNCQDVIADKKKKMRATLTMKFSAYLWSDYEEAWVRSSFLKFLKEFSDKYFFGSKTKRMQHELKNELHELVTELKNYLNLLTFGK